MQIRPVTVRRLRMVLDPDQRRRVVAWALYAAFATHLPWSPRPFGRLSRRIRARLGSAMLDRCGTNVNIEHGARFGSGRCIALGDNSDIGMDALILGSATIGRNVMMGPRCILIATTHAHHDPGVPMNTQGWAPERPIVIEDDVWIGAAAIVLPGCRIGRGSIVGAGSVVTKDVTPYSMVGGNPARVLRTRRLEEGGNRVPPDDTVEAGSGAT